jgi:hypothetical protein
MPAIVRVFNLSPRYSYEVGVLCETVEQGEEFVSWNSGQIAREMSGDYHGCDVEHLPEHDDSYASDYDATKPLEENGLSYEELLKLARESAENALQNALYSNQFEGNVADWEATIQDTSTLCRKLGLNPDTIRAEFDEEYGLTDEDDESEADEALNPHVVNRNGIAIYDEDNVRCIDETCLLFHVGTGQEFRYGREEHFAVEAIYISSNSAVMDIRAQDGKMYLMVDPAGFEPVCAYCDGLGTLSDPTSRECDECDGTGIAR